MRRSARLGPFLLLAGMLTLTAACGDGGDDSATETPAPVPAPAPEPDPAPAPVSIDVADGDRCEILDPSHCLFPFPSDSLTVPDASLDSGRRLNFALESMPVNADGVSIDPTELNRLDGYSPGAQITLFVPGIDLERSGFPIQTRMPRSLDADSGVVLLDTTSGERVPCWAELDATAPSDDQRALVIRPAINLREGHRHVVALRGVVDGSGAEIAPADAFRVLRDDIPTDNDIVEARRAGMNAVFADLDAAGVPREDLYLAWDFTVASQRSLSERLLHMRDDAFASLGGGAPSFTVDDIQDVGVARIVTGTVSVPLYMTGDGGPGTVLNNTGGSPLPTQNGERPANFICVMPATATADEPARLSLYGHGLLGSAGEVRGIGVLGAAVGVMFCASDWIGMASEDIPNVIELLGELSNFHSLPDRLHQAHLNFLFLGRAMRHPDGFGGHPAFQDADGLSALDDTDLFFLGASQGGILGNATTAVAQDWTRAVMAVGATNYSLLVPRSSNYARFEPVLSGGYPDPIDRMLLWGLMQLTWDRGEGNAYLHHLTADPYPDTPVHDILFFEAFADHQVANVATEIAARTIGARLRTPALEPGRATAEEPFFGLPPVETYPHPGSALVIWDFGTPAPPDANLPPTEGEDPHGKASEVGAVLVMVSEYLRTDGALVDVCGGAPCQTLD